MDVDRLLPDGPLVPPTAADGTLLRQTFRNEDSEAADVVYLALRAARVRLWKDLWAKAGAGEERVRVLAEQRVKERTRVLMDENRRLRTVIHSMQQVLNAREWI